MSGPNSGSIEREAGGDVVLDALSAHVAVIDCEGRIVAVNRAWSQFAADNGGKAGLTGVGVNYLDICRKAAEQGAPSARAALLGLESVLAGRQLQFILDYACHSPTERRWFQLQATPLKEPGGGAVTTHITITRQKEAEERLREREARLAAILEKAADGILTIDDQGRIESLNAAAERIFGYDARQLIGQDVSLLMPETYRARHRNSLRKCVTGEIPLPAPGREVNGLRSDGMRVPLELTISAVQLGTRRIFTAIVRDITERKRAGERILLNERLAAIGEAMTGLIHEGRNALQRGQASVELLRLHLEDQPQALDLLARIQRAQDHLHHLYEDVREYAQPIQIHPRLGNIRTLMREAWEHLGLAIQGRDVALFEHGYSGSVLCMADSFAIRQVFVNLLENALEACSDPVEIDIVFEDRQLDDKPYLMVRIGDNGPGMSRQTIEHVFDPFYTTKTHGIGLGIPLARRVLQAHGGDLMLNTNRPRGVEFLALFPRPTVHDEDQSGS